jgi:anti-sigma B factor antagonist
MELSYTDLSDGVRKIDLRGRLDLEGVNAIDLRFTTLTATEPIFAVVDLAEVEFLASMGMATLVRNARAVRLRKGNMVLLNPRPNIEKLLISMGIDQAVPCSTRWSIPHPSRRERLTRLAPADWASR